MERWNDLSILSLENGILKSLSAGEAEERHTGMGGHVSQSQP